MKAVSAPVGIGTAMAELILSELCGWLLYPVELHGAAQPQGGERSG